MTTEQLVIYSMPTCPHCIQAKEYFTTNNISFLEYDVSSDKEAARKMVEKTNQLSVPVIIFSGGDILIGFQQEKVEELLKKNNTG